MSANAKLWRPISLDLPSHTTHRSLLGRRNIGSDAGIDDAARSMKGVDAPKGDGCQGRGCGENVRNFEPGAGAGFVGCERHIANLILRNPLRPS